MPQGSCFGPVLYSVYASTLQEEVPLHIDLHGYADDHVIKKGFVPGKTELATVNELSDCIIKIGNWMNLNRLKMNKDKTELAMCNLRRIKSIRKYLTGSACKTLIHSPVISHLDYINSLFFG